MQAWVAERFPQQAGDSDFVYRQAMRAKALDALRGLLPAASLSNIGIYGTGQAYEQLLLRMRAHPLPEARRYADMMLAELRKVIPSFLQRVDVAERGGEWSAYLASTRDDTARLVERLWPDLGRRARRATAATTSGARRGHAARLRPRRARRRSWSRPCSRQLGCSEREAARRVRLLGHDERVALLRAYVGDRRNRRHRPGAPSSAPTTASSSSPTTARSATCSATACSRSSGSRSASRSATTCPSSWPRPGWASATTSRSGAPRTSTARSCPDFPEQAAYAVALAHRIRYVMQFNAREAMHLIELRSGPQGHPAYRRVAQQMHRAIAEVAGHRALAEAMTFVDHGATDLERLESERRAERRRAGKICNALTRKNLRSPW